MCFFFIDWPPLHQNHRSVGLVRILEDLRTAGDVRVEYLPTSEAGQRFRNDAGEFEIKLSCDQCKDAQSTSIGNKSINCLEQS